MAIAIKTIPTLKDKEAKAFDKKARESYAQKGKENFTKQIKMASKILEKAKL